MYSLSCPYNGKLYIAAAERSIIIFNNAMTDYKNLALKTPAKVYQRLTSKFEFQNSFLTRKEREQPLLM